MAFTPEEAGLDSFVPSLGRRGGPTLRDLSPSFGEGVDFSRLSPQQLTPSFGNNRNLTTNDLSPRFGGVSFNPSALIPSFSAGPSTSFAPSFGGYKDYGSSLLPSFGYAGSGNPMKEWGMNNGMYPGPTAPGPGGGNSGGYNVGQITGDAAILNQYDKFFSEAESTYGVPVNMLKALAWTERGWEGTSPSGAQGLMQIMPNIWGEEARKLGLGDFATNPRSAILMGAWILKQNYDNHEGTWEWAARRYLGLGGPDYYGTTDQTYWNSVKSKWDTLNASGGAIPGAVGGQPYTGGGSGMTSVFGGQNFGVSQGIGTGNNFMDYSYGIALGVGNNHPGVDFASPYGTRTFFPKMFNGMTGTVEIAGGSGYFVNDGGDGPGRGELRIRMQNGDIIIFGHMASISVYNGQTVSWRDFVGTTGTAGSGAHLHLEYRKLIGTDQWGNKKYQAIDPRNVIGN